MPLYRPPGHPGTQRRHPGAFVSTRWYAPLTGIAGDRRAHRDALLVRLGGIGLLILGMVVVLFGIALVILDTGMLLLLLGVLLAVGAVARLATRASWRGITALRGLRRAG